MIFLLHGRLIEEQYSIECHINYKLFFSFIEINICSCFFKLVHKIKIFIFVSIVVVDKQF